MKKWFFSVLFAITLCAYFASAQAAVTIGGTEYLWTPYLWDTSIYESHCVYLSDNGGASYVALSGLPEYVLEVALTDLPNGGLRVEGRDQWEKEYTWSRDYTAAELAATFAGRRYVAPVMVKASNGAVTLAERYLYDYNNGDPALDGSYGWANGSEKCGHHLVYTTDGVTWFPVETEEETYINDIWWDGEQFCSVNRYYGWDTETNQYQSRLFTSTDGIHWTGEEGAGQMRPTPQWTCDLGKYHFEIVVAQDDNGFFRDVYLMDQTHADRGVRLPDFREAFEARGIGPGYIQAWPTPNDTVTVAVYDVNAEERFMAEICYPISSLDWCLENLSETFRTPEVAAQGNGVSLAFEEEWRVGIGGDLLLRNDGSGWQRVENESIGTHFRLLPFNGKTFLLDCYTKDTLYTSEDGLNWKSLSGTALDVGESKYTLRDKYALQWTGDRYITCLQVFEYLVGRGGSWGEWYAPACTQVRFLDENFNLLSSHDFGRQVSGVGFRDGVYYAQVWDRNEVAFGEVGYDTDQSATLYHSTDGKTWTAMPKIYTDLDDVMMAEVGGWNRACVYKEGGPLLSVAQLDRWRFVLSKDERIYLMGDNAQEWVELPDLYNAVAAAGFTPTQITAEYTPEGNVDVTVWEYQSFFLQDRAKSGRISIAYPPDSLDWCKENLVESRFMRQTENREDTRTLANGTEVTTFPLCNGEREVVYRSEATGWLWQYDKEVPWSGNVRVLPYSGKALMLWDNVGFYLTEDGVNWRKADSEWVKERIEWNIFPYSFVWTGEKYLVGFQPFGGWGKGASYLTEDMGKCFFLNENLNYCSEHDFALRDGLNDWPPKNVERVGYADGVCYAELRGLDDDKDEPAIIYRSTDGVNWEQTDIFQVRECLKPLQ